MSGQIEVRAIEYNHGLCTWTTEHDANYFSVYVGEPGAMAWIADFAEKGDALLYARTRANVYGFEFHNRIGEL